MRLAIEERRTQGRMEIDLIAKTELTRIVTTIVLRDEALSGISSDEIRLFFRLANFLYDEDRA